MNNKGQVLIFFVLILPLLLLGATYIVDNIYISYNTNRLNSINDLVLNDVANGKLDIVNIDEYIKKNDSNIVIEKININDDVIQIELSLKIKSIFGFIVGKDYYYLTSNKTMNFK